MSDAIHHAQAKADACAYILHMMLQRLEAERPGFVHGMLEGAKADRAAVQARGAAAAASEAVFDEAIALLAQVHAMNEQVIHQGKTGL